MKTNGNSFAAVVRVITDPEYKEVGGGLTSCRAVHDTSFKDDSGLFTGLNFWGKKGTAASKCIKKGDNVFVRGSLVARTYKEKQYFDIEVYDFDVLSNNGGGGGENKSEPKKTKAVDEVEIDEEIEADIPF